MKNEMNTKRIHGKNSLNLILVLCAALTLILLIGCNDKSNNQASNSEQDNSKQVLTFPSMDTKDEPVEIPLNTALAQLNVDDGENPIQTAAPAVPEMTFPLTSQMKGQVEVALVYRSDMTGGYLLLAPAGWEASAVVGANGSYGVTFQDPKNPEQNLHYSDNAGGCVGCAISGIGTYFPGKAEWADQMGFTIYEPLQFTKQHILDSSGAEARTVRYTLAADSAGYQTDGVAYYDEGEWGYLFRKMEIRLSTDSAQQELIGTIMSFFSDYHGPLFIPGAE